MINKLSLALEAINCRITADTPVRNNSSLTAITAGAFKIDDVGKNRSDVAADRKAERALPP